MEKTILSIDLDIIMNPCIELYNIEIQGIDDPDKLWKDLEEKYDYEKYNLLSYDKETLLNICSLINCNKDKSIHFIQSHEEIVKSLIEQKDYLDSQYHIYNIDFHHDLWYRDTDFTDIIQKDQYDCSDWLGYLYLKKKIASMTWLKASNSILPEFKAYGGNFKLNTLTLKDFDKLKNKDFDEIYICLSPQWIPPRYRIFYDVIQTLIKGE